MAKKNKNRGIVLIKKSNELIESRFKFDIWEMRFFLSVISQIQRDHDEFQVYRVWYSDIIKTFGIKSHQSYAMLREASNKLMRKTIIVDSNDSGFARKKVYHIIRSVDFLAEGQEGKKGVESQEYIDVTVESELKPFLLQLQSRFTAYDIRNVIKLGAYPIRFYELLKQYENIGKRTLGFDELKRMFELENEYPRFATFYQRIIAPSIKEINEYTDLEILSVDKIKQGKKITGVTIKFRSKVLPSLIGPIQDVNNEINASEVYSHTIEIPQNDKADDSSGDERIKIFYPKIVESLGITPSVFFDFLKVYTDAQLEQAIRVTHRAKAEGQIKTNPSGFFVQALKNGYTDQKEERVKKDKKEAIKQKLQVQKSDLEAEKQDKIFERIKELTSANASLTSEAIETLKFTEAGKKAIQLNEQKLQRPLEVEDFRQIKELRMLVIDTLFIKNIAEFSDIIQEYDAKMIQITMEDIF
jgi:plasmid replication initiation protein